MIKKTALLLIFVLAVFAHDSIAANRTMANVLLITMDTTRADHLGCYGYHREITPHIDAVAKDGVVFDNALSVIPLTTPSHISIMTGLHPDRHLVFRNSLPMNASTPMMAELFKQAGYRTAAFVSTRLLNAGLGFKRGFDYFSGVSRRYKKPMRPGNKTVDAALRWLDVNCGGRFFVWLHLYDPHLPYAPPLEFGLKFNPDYAQYLKTIESDGEMPQDYAGYVAKPEGKPLEKTTRSDPSPGDKARRQGFPRRIDPSMVRQMVDAYDGEIAYTDALLGKVFSTLKEKKVFDNTAIVLMADHGEILYEQADYFGHHKFLYQGALRIPLIFKLPHVPAGRRPIRITNVDILPTLLDFMGMETNAAMDGISYWPHIEVAAKVPLPEHLVVLTHPRSALGKKNSKKVRHLRFAQAFQKMGIITDRWKLLLENETAGLPQNKMFDLGLDPLELNNLLGQENYRASQRELERYANRYLNRHKELKIERKHRRQRNRSVVNDLRSLGYAR